MKSDFAPVEDDLFFSNLIGTSSNSFESTSKISSTPLFLMGGEC